MSRPRKRFGQREPRYRAAHSSQQQSTGWQKQTWFIVLAILSFGLALLWLWLRASAQAQQGGALVNPQYATPTALPQSSRAQTTSHYQPQVIEDKKTTKKVTSKLNRKMPEYLRDLFANDLAIISYNFRDTFGVKHQTLRKQAIREIKTLLIKLRELSTDKQWIDIALQRPDFQFVLEPSSFVDRIWPWGGGVGAFYDLEQNVIVLRVDKNGLICNEDTLRHELWHLFHGEKNRLMGREDLEAKPFNEKPYSSYTNLASIIHRDIAHAKQFKFTSRAPFFKCPVMHDNIIFPEYMIKQWQAEGKLSNDLKMLGDISASRTIEEKFHITRVYMSQGYYHCLGYHESVLQDAKDCASFFQRRVGERFDGFQSPNCLQLTATEAAECDVTEKDAVIQEFPSEIRKDLFPNHSAYTWSTVEHVAGLKP